jgi:hypothetical protein
LARVGTGSVYTNEDTWIEERLAAGAISRRIFCKKKHHASRWLQKRWLRDQETSTFIKFLGNVPDAPACTIRH